MLWKLTRPDAKSYTKYLVKGNFYYPEVCSVRKTFDKLANSNLSIARFGDGELLLSIGRNIKFQKANRKLRLRLVAVLNDINNPNCIIALVEYNKKHNNDYSKQFWFENISDFGKLFLNNEEYFNARITRELDKEDFHILKEIWDEKNIIFVTGKDSRFNTNHVLFNNARSKHFIYSKARNAWDEYSSTLNRVIKESNNIDKPIVICSLGPSATVLAYDLSKMGIRTLDLGHITNIYDVVVHGLATPEKLYK
ncbi:MAG: GT-D fold domain-containing glycosyltransferase [Salinivirgaceae bacterium]|nr:GT-D fold domain-containing glycosyltransferase [Salinivirgaceae bacterium]